MSNNQIQNDADGQSSAYTSWCLVNASTACRALGVFFSNIEFWGPLSDTRTPAWRERVVQHQNALVMLILVAYIDYVFWLMKAMAQSRDCIPTAQFDSMLLAADYVKDHAKRCLTSLQGLSMDRYVASHNKLGILLRSLISELNQMKRVPGLLRILRDGELTLEMQEDFEAVLHTFKNVHVLSGWYLEGMSVRDMVVTDRDLPTSIIEAKLRVMECVPLPEDGNYADLWAQTNFRGES